jgi:hypothetical protein
MPAVFPAEPLRYQNLDGLAHQFLALETEQLFRPGVYEDDSALFIDKNDPVRRRFGQRAKDGVTDALVRYGHKPSNARRAQR